jgi:acyl carrier protein
MTLPSGRSATLAIVTDEILALINAETRAADLGADSALVDAGMDSARVLQLVCQIEERYDIELDADDDDDLRTVDDVARLVLLRIRERGPLDGTLPC